MILAKAPLRVSFFGGSSDIPQFYCVEPGATVSMAIDKYVYVAVMHTPHDHVKVSYSEQEIVPEAKYLKNELIRETLDNFNIEKNIEITTFADIPTGGTGLGGSSAFVCALVRALEMYSSSTLTYTNYDVAGIASYVEIVKCKKKIGKQDQFASAFGGINFIEYTSPRDLDYVSVTALDDVVGIHKGCILVPILGERGEAQDIIKTIDFEEKRPEIRKLADIARDFRDLPPMFSTYSRALNECWELKKKTSSSVSNKEVDDVYIKAKKAGANGCKLLGAGGGGYMLVMALNLNKIEEAFPDRKCLRFKTAQDGARVVYYD